MVRLHLHAAGLWIEAVLPKVGDIVHILAEGVVAQHMLQLVGRRNVENQRAARPERPVRGAEKRGVVPPSSGR